MMDIENYAKLSDKELITLLRQDNKEIEDYILEKYKPIVRMKARKMFLVGGETDDLIQEGMIGLYKAIRDYDISQDVTFATFADVCITRNIYSAINTNNRKKHGPLNTYVSFYSEDYNDIRNDDNNPERLFIDKENVEQIEKILHKELSKLEQQVFAQYMEGKGYIDIAEYLGKTPKSIDNAIQRIKIKTSRILDLYRI